MIGKLIRFFVLILLAPLIYAFTYEALLFIFRSGITFKSVQWFLLGFALAMLIYAVLPRDRTIFWEVFDHELTHLITGLMFFKRPSSFVVAPGEADGAVGMPLGFGSTPIRLAPYCLPLFTLPFLLINPFLPPPFDQIANFLIGFTLALHYASLIAWEFRFSQTDFTNTGVIFSVVITIFLNIVVLVLILGIVTGNYTGLVDYFKNAYDRTGEAYTAALEFLQTGVIPAISEWLGR
jgi:hypothetical protein